MFKTDTSRYQHFSCLVQVSDLSQARRAVVAGAAGLIAKGQESAGLVSDISSFILLQTLLAENFDLPIWSQGGIGIHTAAGAMAGDL